MLKIDAGHDLELTMFHTSQTGFAGPERVRASMTHAQNDLLV
jgi:hypothetical protein